MKLIREELGKLNEYANCGADGHCDGDQYCFNGGGGAGYTCGSCDDNGWQNPPDECAGIGTIDQVAGLTTQNPPPPISDPVQNPNIPKRSSRVQKRITPSRNSSRNAGRQGMPMRELKENILNLLNKVKNKNNLKKRK